MIYAKSEMTFEFNLRAAFEVVDAVLPEKSEERDEECSARV